MQPFINMTTQDGRCILGGTTRACIADCIECSTYQRHLKKLEKTLVSEQQDTTTVGDKISGELVFRFDAIDITDFLKYRRLIREITGFKDRVKMAYFMVEEQALLNSIHPEKTMPAQGLTLEEKEEKFRKLVHPNPSGSTGKKISVDVTFRKDRCDDGRRLLRGQHQEPTLGIYGGPKGKARTFCMTFPGPEEEVINAYLRAFKLTRVPHHVILAGWKFYHPSVIMPGQIVTKEPGQQGGMVTTPDQTNTSTRKEFKG
jgi:hypothetical protein